jgi:hypothetical protein
MWGLEMDGGAEVSGRILDSNTRFVSHTSQGEPSQVHRKIFSYLS